MKKYIVFLILALSTLFFILSYEPYQNIGSEVLINPDFNDGLTSWKYSTEQESVLVESHGIVRLRSDNIEKSVSLTQIIPEPSRFKLLRLSGEVRTENVVPGKKGWQRARLILSSHDKDGKWLPSPHHVVLLTGTKDWKICSGVFKIIPEAGQLQVTAQLPRATGTMWVRNLSLREVVEKSSAHYFSIFFLLLWAILLAYILIPHVRHSKTFVLQLLVIASAAAVLLGTLTPEERLNRLETDSVQAVKKLIEPAVSTAPKTQEEQKIKEVTDRAFADFLHLASKVGHFIFFTLLVLSFWSAQKEKNLQIFVPDLLMLAAGTEMMQYFVRGRTPLVLDFFIDTGGIVLGMLIIFAWRQSLRSQDSGLGTEGNDKRIRIQD